MSKTVVKYQQYAEYKDSGVEWLGEVPSHWDLKPSKFLFNIVNGSTPKSGVEEYWEGDITWVTPSDLSKIESFEISESARSITNKGLDSCGTSLVPSGSMILSCRAPIGSLAITTTEVCTNQGCKSLVAIDEINTKFIYYFLSVSTEQLNILGRGTTFLELSSDELGNLKIPFPVVNEAEKIANFLDYETAKIDSLIEKQQLLIQLLKEKRQAVISHAVTKGLNPNVPMKDSGVEWLGGVPEHWKVMKFNRCVQIRNGLVDPRNITYKNLILYAPNHIEKATGKILFTETAEEQGADSNKYLCFKGEVVYSKIRPALAKVAICEEDIALCSADMYPINAANGLTNNFLYYFLCTRQISQNPYPIRILLS